MENRPPIAENEMAAPIGSDMPEKKPLPLLPDREWLVARIHEVNYQVAMFNNQPQYLTDMEDNPILDSDGNKIYRKEFEIVFSFQDHLLSNGEPRKAWLRMGASMGKKANLPVFLFNVLGVNPENLTPKQVIELLTGKAVRLQMANKPSEDRTKIYQKVLYDAVKSLHAPVVEDVKPIPPKDLDPDPRPGMQFRGDDDAAPWDTE